MSSRNFHIMDVSFGLVPEREGITIFGHNRDMDAANGEIISSTGNNVSAPPVRTAASTISIVSSSAADTAAGTGARTVLIEGLDSDYDSISEIVTMDGTTPVVTTASFIAVNRTIVYTAGSGLTNAGAIASTHVTDSYFISNIEAGDSVSDSTVYTMPRNKKGFLSKLDLNSAKPTSGTDPEVTFRLKVYSQTQGVIYTALNEIISNTTVSRYFDAAKLEVIRPKETIWVEAVTTQNDTVVSTRMNIILAAV